MDLRRLEYFMVLAEELHFRRAAERLHISQPGLSQQIRVLEKDLGVSLFERSAQGVVLTDPGFVLLKEGAHLLQQAESVAAHVRAAGKGIAGILRVVHSRSLTGDVPDEIVRRFRMSNPRVEIIVETAWTTRNIAMLRAGEVDAAFVRMPLLEVGDLSQLTLGHTELAAAIPADLPLARKRILQTADLRGIPVVTFPREQAPGYFDHILSTVWGDEGPLISTTEPDPEHLLAAVAAGAGVCVFDVQRALKLRPKGVVVRRFTPSLSADFGLLWSPHRMSSLLESFIAEASLARPREP
ncbi:LysR family transcriptional regulator [Pseudarthrobacter sulfonivorans]|nr:LysR substrate-binding domain-containing protein [Pseudarthrobacter sulfonivorans]